MNYSYVMGIDNINKLKEENFEIQQFGNSFGVVFSDEKIKLFEEYICKSLKNGFWNEYLGKEKVFISGSKTIGKNHDQSCQNP